MDTADQTQRAYTTWRDVKRELKTVRDMVKQAQANDKALQDALEEKQMAGERYRAEKFQFDGKHEQLLKTLAEAKAQEKEAHLLFTDCYTAAMQQQLSFELFDEGRKVEVTIATKAKVVDEKPAKEPVTPDDDGDA